MPRAAAAAAARGGISLATYNAVLKDPSHRDPRVFIVPADQTDFADRDEVRQRAALRRRRGAAGDRAVDRRAARPIRPGRSSSRRRRRAARTCSTCSSRRIIPTTWTSAASRAARTTTPAGRSPIRWASSSIAFSNDVTGALQGRRGARRAAPRQGQRHRDRGLPAVAVGQRLVHHRQPRAEGERRGLPPRRADERQRPRPIRPARSTSRPSAASTPIVQKGAQELGVNVDATTARPDAGATKLAPRRIALWDTTTGSMPSGWTRFLLERFEFPFTVVCGAGFDDTALRSKYDVIILPSGAAFRRRRRSAAAVAVAVAAMPNRPPVPGAAAERSRSAQPLPGDHRYRQRRERGGQRQEVRARRAASSIARGHRRRASIADLLDAAGVGLSRRAAAGPGGARAQRRQVLRARARCCASRSIRPRRRPPAPRITSTCSSTTDPVFRLAPERRRRTASVR